MTMNAAAASVIWHYHLAMSRLLSALCTAAFVLLLSVHARAEVVKLVVEQRQPLPNQTQPYEKLTGRFYGELDPTHPLNAVITDLELAPRNARGMVEYSATFTILKPADMSRATGVLVYQVPNRGQANDRRAAATTRTSGPTGMCSSPVAGRPTSPRVPVSRR